MLDKMELGAVAVAVTASAILVARWGWREARQYQRARQAIRRIAIVTKDAISQASTSSTRDLNPVDHESLVPIVPGLRPGLSEDF